MLGVFVADDGGVSYAIDIVNGIKPVETRKRNTLRALVGHRVAIIRTRKHKKPAVVGYADIVKAEYLSAQELDDIREKTRIPRGSVYDAATGKWCYWVTNTTPCSPYPLPAEAVRHGRTWCEW